MTTRICLIGLPRCGSQYISELIVLNSPHSIKGLSEPFTPRHELSLNNLDISITDFNSYKEQVSTVIDKIKLFNNDQPLMMKIFLHSWSPLQEHDRIIQVLKELNFTFVIVKRKNIVDQLFSLGIGLKLNKFTNFDSYDNSVVKLDWNELLSMKTLQDDLVKFDNLLNKFNLTNCTTIYYETAISDITKFLGKNIRTYTRYKRMSTIPSADRISNIDEVLKFLNITI
jgi:hypothetical protein